MQNYYAILGLPVGASKEQIKHAYRKKVLQFHPDRNKSEGAREMFIKIVEAYEALTNTPDYHYTPIEEKPLTKAEQRAKRTQENLKRRAEKERLDREKLWQGFNQLKHSKGYKVGLFINVLCLVMIFTLLIDKYLLPINQVSQKIGYKELVQYIGQNEKGENTQMEYAKLYVCNNWYQIEPAMYYMLSDTSSIITGRSFIFGDILYIGLWDANDMYSSSYIDNEFSRHSFFFTFLLLLGTPLFIINKPSVSMYILSHAYFRTAQIILMLTLIITSPNILYALGRNYCP